MRLLLLQGSEAARLGDVLRFHPSLAHAELQERNSSTAWVSAADAKFFRGSEGNVVQVEPARLSTSTRLGDGETSHYGRRPVNGPPEQGVAFTLWATVTN